jgi:3-hydroxyacyl-CoA dehydrogenase
VTSSTSWRPPGVSVRRRAPATTATARIAARRTIRPSTNCWFAFRQVTDEEILERCLYAMVNEAAKILEEGAAARPGDIDVIWTSGFGWPAYLGGPMFWVDQIGLPKIKDALDRYSSLVGEEYFAPAPLIVRLVAEGRGFHG